MQKLKDKPDIRRGILLMVISSVCTCTGQFLWKTAATSTQMIILYILGLVLYGLGAVMMITAFKFGEMSVLHPMLSVGFILSLFLGAVFLDEPITWKSLLGIILILIGMIFLGKTAEGI